MRRELFHPNCSMHMLKKRCLTERFHALTLPGNWYLLHVYHNLGAREIAHSSDLVKPLKSISYPWVPERDQVTCSRFHRKSVAGQGIETGPRRFPSNTFTTGPSFFSYKYHKYPSSFGSARKSLADLRKMKRATLMDRKEIGKRKLGERGLAMTGQ